MADIRIEYDNRLSFCERRECACKGNTYDKYKDKYDLNYVYSVADMHCVLIYKDGYGWKEYVIEKCPLSLIKDDLQRIYAQYGIRNNIDNKYNDVWQGIKEELNRKKIIWISADKSYQALEFGCYLLKKLNKSGCAALSYNAPEFQKICRRIYNDSIVNDIKRDIWIIVNGIGHEVVNDFYIQGFCQLVDYINGTIIMCGSCKPYDKLQDMDNLYYLRLA